MADSFFLYFFFLFVFDFVQTGVVETDEENEERSSETDEEYTPVKKKQGADLINEERTGKRKRKETKKEKDEVIESPLAKISVEDLEKAEKEAKNLNFTVGSGAYVALVVLLAGKAVGVTSMSAATIEKFARQLSLEGETKNGKKTKMGSFIRLGRRWRADETNFLRNEDGTYSLANKLEKKEKETMTKEEIESAVKEINDNDNEVLANAEKKAVEFNFTVGSGAYVALVVLLAGEAVGIKSMTPTTIEEFARQLGLEGKTKNGKKTKMDRSTIRKAMKSDNNTNYFLVNEDARYVLSGEGIEEEEGDRRRRRRQEGDFTCKKQLGSRSREVSRY